MVYLQGQALALIFTKRLAFLPAKENSKTYLINYSHTRKSIKFLSRQKTTRKPLHPQKKVLLCTLVNKKKMLQKKNNNSNNKKVITLFFS
jgi:hypothetical protein